VSSPVPARAAIHASVDPNGGWIKIHGEVRRRWGCLAACSLVHRERSGWGARACESRRIGVRREAGGELEHASRAALADGSETSGVGELEHASRVALAYASEALRTLGRAHREGQQGEKLAP
jgi:hypothetical protein